MEKIEIQFNFTKKDLYLVSKEISLKHFSPLAIFIFLAFNIFGVIFPIGFGIIEGDYFVPTLPILLIEIIVLITTPMSIKNKVSKTHDSSEVMRNPQIYNLGENEISIQTSNSHITYQYEQLYTVQETKSCFLFYPSISSSFCIPKRVLLSDEERSFVKLCMKKVPKNKVVKNKWRGFMTGITFYIIIFFIIVVLFRNFVVPN